MFNSNRVLTILLFFLVSSNLLAQDALLIQTCAACHGENGISPSAEWPNLAGQKKGYLISQINAFRDGRRQNELMTPIVQNLSARDIEQLAQYYSDMPAPEMSEDKLNELGRHVRARCISCHGREAIAVNTEWPNLAGQKAVYLKQQLLNYRSGDRKHLLMEVIANELTKDEIEAVAEFFN